MRILRAGLLVKLMGQLAELEGMVATAEHSRAGARNELANDYVRQQVRSRIIPLEAQSALAGLSMSRVAVHRVLQYVDSSDALPMGHLMELINDFRRRVPDECETILFFSIDPEDARYYNEPLSGWDVVAEQFPGTIGDIEEASKCLALERYTGSVFHTMRIAEAGLGAIAKRVGLTNPRPGWAPDFRSQLKSQGKPDVLGDVRSDSVFQAIRLSGRWRDRGHRRAPLPRCPVLPAQQADPSISARRPALHGLL
jgi:hypothetical protein